MADLKLSVNIGTRDLQSLATYKHAGVIDMYKGKKLFRGPKWCSRYVVIFKGTVTTWNLFCYTDHRAEKAVNTYSMLDFESVKAYDDFPEGINCFMIKFEKATTPLIFSCDRKESKMIWIEHIRCAIDDAHRFSADSAYASGGSIVSESNRISKPYNTISEITAEDDTSQSFIHQDLEPENVIEKPSHETMNLNTDSKLNDQTTDDQTKHSYENMRAENHALHETATKHGLPDKERNDGQRHNSDTTYLKDLESYPVQETKHQKLAKREETTSEEQLTTKGSPKKSRKKNSVQGTANSETTTSDMDPPYENINYGMEDLKLEVPIQDSARIAHQTDVKQIVQDVDQTHQRKFIKHDENHDKVINEMKLKNSKTRLPTSITGDENQRPQFATLSPIREDSTHATTFNSPSFLSVQEGHASATETEAFASVREGTDQSITMHPPVKERQIQSRATDLDITESTEEDRNSPSLREPKSLTSTSRQTGNSTAHHAEQNKQLLAGSKSVVSVNKNHDSSALKRSQSAASNDGQEVHPQYVRSVSQTCRKKSQVYSSSQSKQYGTSGLASPSVTEPGPCAALKEPSLSLDTGNEMSFGEKQTLSTTASSCDTFSALKQPMPATRTHKQTNRPPISQAEDYAVQEGKFFNENTEICTTDPDSSSKKPGNIRISNNSQDNVNHRSSSSSASSISSSGSEVSLKHYENPDEGANPDYQNTKVFEREEYFCPERKKVKRIMKNSATGTFLIYPGETTSEEICVMTPYGIKCFRVHKKEGKYSLFSKASPNQAFPSMDNLLYYYHMIDNLPSTNYEVKLTRGYNSKESSA